MGNAAAHESSRRSGGTVPIDEDAHQREKLSILGHMTTSVAHDLNNPLTSIATSVASVLTFWPTDEDPVTTRNTMESLREDLELVAEETQRARHIIAGLLEFASKRQPKHEIVSVGDIARSCWRLAKHHFEQHRLGLICECNAVAGQDHILGDPHRLQQVVMNLVINSQQALTQANRRGTVWIRVQPGSDNTVHLLVEDDGPGVAPDLHQTIFSPYYTTKSSGTGLGLAIARQIIADGQGQLTIEDRPEGGACFRVTLPAAPDRSPGSAPGADNGGPAPMAPQAFRILVVDDEPGILKSTSRFLRRYGWTVDLADDGSVALDMMNKHTYDAVLSDLRMPGLNGEELYAEILRHHPRLATRIAFVSGDTMRNETRAFLEQCGCPTLQKPYELTDLLAVLQTCAGNDTPSGPGAPGA